MNGLIFFLQIIDAFLVIAQQKINEQVGLGCHLNNVFILYQLTCIANFEYYLLLAITDITDL